MGQRRKSREAAVQLLYQVELEGDGGPEGFERAWEALELGPPAGRAFAEELVEAVQTGKADLDARIEAAADNWQLSRISRVDLSILRMAACEMLRSRDVPVTVVVDEAVEIAKRFSGEKSAAFVNGVLDRLARQAGLLKGDTSSQR